MEIFGYLVIGLLIVVSPGADFVLVLKNSLSKGRVAGLLTGLGIGIGTCVHITYSILGIGHLLSQNEFIFSLIKYAGSAYLIYLGVTGLFGSKPVIGSENTTQVDSGTPRYFIQGFLCNLLNPKTVLFFLSVFSQIISADNGSFSDFVLIYGLYIALLHIIWFCLIAFLITSSPVSGVFQKFGRRINQVCGAGLVAFGLMLSGNS